MPGEGACRRLLGSPTRNARRRQRAEPAVAMAHLPHTSRSGPTGSCGSMWHPETTDCHDHLGSSARSGGWIWATSLASCGWSARCPLPATPAPATHLAEVLLKMPELQTLLEFLLVLGPELIEGGLSLVQLGQEPANRTGSEWVCDAGRGLRLQWPPVYTLATALQH